MWAFKRKSQSSGVVAQLVEHLLCKQGVVSSSLISSTRIKGKGDEKSPFSEETQIQIRQRG